MMHPSQKTRNVNPPLWCILEKERKERRRRKKKEERNEQQ